MGGDPSRVRLTGPLAVFGEGFTGELAWLGYKPNAAADQLRLMAHLSRWMSAGRIEPAGLTPEVARDQRASRKASRLSGGLYRPDHLGFARVACRPAERTVVAITETTVGHQAGDRMARESGTGRQSQGQKLRGVSNEACATSAACGGDPVQPIPPSVPTPRMPGPRLG